MWGYVCIRFIYFMVKGKSLLDYFLLTNMKKNDKIILKYFQ